MNSETNLTRLGAVAALLGSLLLLVSTMLHPLAADPNDAEAAFAEYAADKLWVASHFGQFLGICLIGAALVALTQALLDGPSRVWARLGLAAATASVATSAALQAVDGVALKVVVDRWAAAPAADRQLVFEAAFAVRQIEIGLASLLSLLFGLAAAVYGIAIVHDERYPTWLGWLGVLSGIGTVVAGVVQAYTGFSGLAMAMSMPASALLLVWIVMVSAFIWRRAGRLV